MPQSGAGKPRDALYVSYRPFRASFRSVAERSRSSVFSFDSHPGTCRMLAPLFGGSQSFFVLFMHKRSNFWCFIRKSILLPDGECGLSAPKCAPLARFRIDQDLAPADLVIGAGNAVERPARSDDRNLHGFGSSRELYGEIQFPAVRIPHGLQIERHPPEAGRAVLQPERLPHVDVLGNHAQI